MSITDYENEYISCDVKLINATPFEGSPENQDVYFDSNFLCFTLYDENYIPIDIGRPVNTTSGTQGESNKLAKNQVLKGQIGPLKGSYDGAIPKYIAFEYAGEYTEQSYLTYCVYYEIPDGLFDTTYVDMSVMGADSAEQALQLCKEAMNNNDANIAKKISLYYYMCYEKTGRLLLEEWEYIDYLLIKAMDRTRSKEEMDFIKEEINQDNYSETIFEVKHLEKAQDIMSEFGGTGYLQAGYCYEYEVYDDDGHIFAYLDMYILMCDGRWFVMFH